MEQNKVIENKVIELRIFNDKETLFETGDSYVIPRYQRAYAWEDKEIIQLIDDINDIDENNTNNYYIGSLIVSRIKGKNNTFEVVDGQQRLTTLFLILQYLVHKKVLKCDIKQAISFDCRTKSNYTLGNIKEILEKNENIDDEENIESSIINGIKIIRKKFKEDEAFAKNFISRLRQVILYRIEVPENTDLNRYFEIMNTRGEQLEQHDILKAQLMGYLDDRKKQELFSRIWNACSDMTGYVQMHFSPEERKNIFSDSWNGNPNVTLETNNCDSNNGDTTPTIREIIEPNFRVDNTDGKLDDGTPIRFDSIIDFPHFLLHALRVYIKRHRIGEKILGDLLDDKKLITDFTKVIDEYSDNKKFSESFIVHLLQARYLFDKFIIKREYTGEDSEGEWSLKELSVSKGKQQKTKNWKAYYPITKLRKGQEQEMTYKPRNKECLMIQSALRVSYTSPKVMHWITDLLYWLFENIDNLPQLVTEAENIAAQAVQEDFLKKENYKLGVQTPHIVFNYLDYLLWKQDKKQEKPQYSDFEFEFRNSVEHWYPQHPTDCDSWDDKDTFGNLCIISRNVNSKFSNLSPESKMKSYEKMVKKGSIKLRIMGSIITETENNNESWIKDQCQIHEEKMIELLKGQIHKA